MAAPLHATAPHKGYTRQLQWRPPKGLTLKAGIARAAVASRVSRGPGTLMLTATLLDLSQGYAYTAVTADTWLKALQMRLFLCNCMFGLYRWPIFRKSISTAEGEQPATWLRVPGKRVLQLLHYTEQLLRSLPAPNNKQVCSQAFQTIFL